LSTIKLKSSKSHKNTTVTIAKTKTPIKTRENTYQYIKINLSINKNDSNNLNAEIDFKVLKNWTTKYNYTISDILLERFHDNNWNGLNTTFLYEDNESYYFTATTPGFSEFAITGNKKEYEFINKIKLFDAGQEKINKTIENYDFQEAITPDEVINGAKKIFNYILLIVVILIILVIVIVLTNRNKKGFREVQAHKEKSEAESEAENKGNNFKDKKKI